MDTSWGVGPCSYFLGLSPGKQPFLALDSITMPDFSLCASSYELFFLCKNPTAANLPEWRFPIKKNLQGHLQISNQFEARQNCSNRKEERGTLVFGLRRRVKSWRNRVLFPLEESTLRVDTELVKAWLWHSFRSGYERFSFPLSTH